jgi:hypothetical protein
MQYFSDFCPINLLNIYTMDPPAPSKFAAWRPARPDMPAVLSPVRAIFDESMKS